IPPRQERPRHRGTSLRRLDRLRPPNPHTCKANRPAPDREVKSRVHKMENKGLDCLAYDKFSTGHQEVEFDPIFPSRSDAVRDETTIGKFFAVKGIAVRSCVRGLISNLMKRRGV